MTTDHAKLLGRWARRGASVFVVGALSACASGGSEDTATESAGDDAEENSQDDVEPAVGPESGGASAAGCVEEELDDLWLDGRLGCLSVGQNITPTIHESLGEVADRAFVVAQQVVDSSFENVLGSGKKRHFRYLVCVREVGADASRTGATVPFASELVRAFRLNMSTSTPGTSTLSLNGGTGPNTLETPCDSAVHPVIIDVEGNIESVNPDAVPELEIFDY